MRRKIVSQVLEIGRSRLKTAPRWRLADRGDPPG
jgi:hypothetical protein